MPHKKVLFRLTKDEDGYPPMDIEGMWVEEVDGELIVDNIPFFSRDVTDDDVIDIEEIDGELFYKSTVRPSQNSLLRVVLFKPKDPTQLRAGLKKLGCDSEYNHIHSLVSVNVPIEASLEKVQEFLAEGQAKHLWEYEEAILRQ